MLRPRRSDRSEPINPKAPELASTLLEMPVSLKLQPCYQVQYRRRMKNKNVLVISHRRSGTHLTIDSIRNNFKALRESVYVTLETLDHAHPDHLSVAEFRQSISDHRRVIKVHYLPDVSEHLASEEARCAEDVFSQSKQIYVVRNGLHVLFIA